MASLNEPHSAYIRFCRHMMTAPRPAGKTPMELLTSFQEKWSVMSRKEKKPFEDAYAADMTAYHAALVGLSGAKCMSCKQHALSNPTALGWCCMPMEFTEAWATGALDAMKAGIASTGTSISLDQYLDVLRSSDGKFWLCADCADNVCQ
jgi:hypothetical protein